MTFAHRAIECKPDGFEFVKLPVLAYPEHTDIGPTLGLFGASDNVNLAFALNLAPDLIRKPNEHDVIRSFWGRRAAGEAGCR